MWKNLFNNDSLFESVLNSKINYPVDIYQTQTGLIIQIAAVGASRQHININVQGNELTVSHNSCTQTSAPIDNIRQSIARRSFNFCWKIAPNYDINNIDAKLDKGLLIISIPRCQKALQIKKIEIK